MAHAVDRLVLLYSYPDTVRDSTLHKTLKSSRLTARSQPYGEPRGTFGLAMADCKYRAPPTPHLAQCNNYSRLLKILQVILPTFNQNALLNLKILLKYDKGNDENTRIIARAHRESGWLRTDRYGLYRILSEPRAQAEKFPCVSVAVELSLNCSSAAFGGREVVPRNPPVFLCVSSRKRRGKLFFRE